MDWIKWVVAAFVVGAPFYVVFGLGPRIGREQRRREDERITNMVIAELQKRGLI